jgi:hypothetical protein
VSRALPGEPVCQECEFRAGIVELGPDGQVIDVLCQTCAARGPRRAGSDDGKLVVGGIPRAFYRGAYNAEIS